MDTMIPLNGRIAIVDDSFEQALPLMRVLSKHNIPYVFYKGNDIDYLPDKPENDIRILFLDLNLLGGRDIHPKDIRSSLFSTISRIVSPDNYPYIMILWSRQEKEYKSVLEELFKTDLRKCAPIAILNWIKSDFFPNFAETEENKEKENTILYELKKVLSGIPAYSYLLKWENCVHVSADKTIQGVFREINPEDWENKANCILELFAHSYLDKHYINASSVEKVHASLLFLNDVYYDNMEATIQNEPIENAAAQLVHNVAEEDQRIIRSKINASIIFSQITASINQPGCVYVWKNDENPHASNIANAILNDCIDTQKIREFLKKEDSGSCIKKMFNECIKKTKQSIKNTFIRACGVVVSPLCDYAQNKTKYDRVLLGIIVNQNQLQDLDIKSDSLFVSPVFYYESQPCAIVLHLRYFMTEDIMKNEEITSLFRFRNSILSEIQSKLARHISRHGTMTL